MKIFTLISLLTLLSVHAQNYQNDYVDVEYSQDQYSRDEYAKDEDEIFVRACYLAPNCLGSEMKVGPTLGNCIRMNAQSVKTLANTCANL